MDTQYSLQQNPHALRERKENKLEVALGHQIRFFRKRLGITLADLATTAGISLGMLSKIENGMTSPSLTSLQQLSIALGVPMTAFFQRFEQQREAVFVAAGSGLEIERRGTRAGHQYNLLGHTGGVEGKMVVEPYLLTLTETSDVFPTFQHKGLEFLYMLEGRMSYLHNDQLYRMQPGDSLSFDADAPHGPKDLIELPIKFLSVISYLQTDEATA